MWHFPPAEPQELRSAADWGALHPERAPLLQRLQQGVQWRGVPLWQQLPGDERAASRTGQPGRWADFPHPGTVRSGGAGDQLEQRVWSWKLGVQRWTFQSKANSQGRSSEMTGLAFFRHHIRGARKHLGDVAHYAETNTQGSAVHR